MLYAFALKFFKCLYLDSHISQSIQVQGGLFQSPGTHPGCLHSPAFSNAYISAVTYQRAFRLELGYLGGSSAIPKEHSPGFVSVGWGKGSKSRTPI